jgi:hypothetical protein
MGFPGVSAVILRRPKSGSGTSGAEWYPQLKTELVAFSRISATNAGHPAPRRSPWRISFRFDGPDATDVNYEDYH